MVSDKQLKANRRNAKLCTGPKDKSKSKLSRLVHGLRSNQVIIRGESREEFDELACNIKENFNSRNGLEAILLDQIVFAFWKIRRCRNADRLFIEKNSRLVNGVNKYDVDWSGVFRSGVMNNLTRYETTALNQVKKLFDMLRAYRNLQAVEVIDADVSDG